MEEKLRAAVTAAVEAWQRWLPSWAPGSARGRSPLCRRCVGSPLVLAAGFPEGVPHPVRHALVSRMQRIIDRSVDEEIQKQLPHLQEELNSATVWKPPGFYDPREGLPPEAEGLPFDPEPEPGEQPFLFTLAELAEATLPQPPLPRPPLSTEEKQRIRAEIERADQVAVETGNLVCFLLAEHRDQIRQAIEVFVEPRVQELLDELSSQLESPRS